MIGAGYTGIAVAAAMIKAGLEIDVLDARTEVGGLWRDGVYDHVTLITTRKVTAFDGWPMPEGGLFPTGVEMLAYLTQVAKDSGVLARFTGGQRITSIEPRERGWLVGDTTYDGVVLATGLFTLPLIPSFPGSLSVRTLHTADYKNVDQLGDNVLVVGLGNSGADVAHQCWKAGKRVTMAVQRPRHVIPKRVLGVPVVELHRPRYVPDLPVRLALDLSVRALSAYWRRGSLAQPKHLLLSESPVVHSALLPGISKGRIAVRPGVAGLDGDTVRFTDSTTGVFDTVVWATGYSYRLPIERELLDGSISDYGASPLSLVGGMWSPISFGLAAVGHREPRHGRGPYLSVLAEAVAAGALAQERVDEPIGRVLAKVAAPDGPAVIDDGPEFRKLRRLRAAALGA